MPRGNIFKSKKLSLDYDGKFFILRKWNEKNQDFNEDGSKYDKRGAYNLKINIDREINNSQQGIEYRLEEFNISNEAKELIENYKKSLDAKLSKD